MGNYNVLKSICVVYSGTHILINKVFIDPLKPRHEKNQSIHGQTRTANTCNVAVVLVEHHAGKKSRTKIWGTCQNDRHSKN